jgi:F-type H+-transporting ATPase subunit b
MLIDWFTVGAQALNFLILVWLMRHFLYKPILHAIDAREKIIAAELADAAAKKAEAQKDRDEFQHKNEEFDQQRSALLTKATDEAKTERRRLLGEARQAADALSAKRQETLKNDAKNLSQAIARRTQEEVFAITRKALTDLATTSLEERMGAVFTRRLREMEGKAKETLGAALKTTPEPAVVRSAFELPAEQRATIQNALNETFSADIHLRFETTPELVSGIELTANGQKVAWSIADYLASLEKGVGELLKQQDKPEPKPAAPAPPEEEAKVEPAPKPDSEAKAKSKTEAEPKAAPKSDETPTPIPETETKAKPPSDAERKAAPKPAAEAKPPSKPDAQVEPAAELVAPAKSEPEVKAEPAKPKTEAEPEVKTDAAPMPAAKPETKAAAKPAAEVLAKPQAAEAAPVAS